MGDELRTSGVRPALPSDVDAIIDLHLRARTEYYRGFLPDAQIAADNRTHAANRDAYAAGLADPEFTMLCATGGDRVLGFIFTGPCHYPDPDPTTTHELRLLYVDPAHFRQGIGNRLHRAAVRAWQQAGVRSARLWVWGFNSRARAFYSAQGWRPDGAVRPDNEPIAGHDMLGYRLAVTGS